MDKEHRSVWELFEKQCSCPYSIESLVERVVTEDKRSGPSSSTICWPWIIHLTFMSLGLLIQINVTHNTIHRTVLRFELDNGFERAL